MGNLRQAAAYFGEGLALSEVRRDRRAIIYCLAGIAGIARQLGQSERAARLFGAVDAVLESSGIVFEPIEWAEYQRHRAATRTQLSQSTFDLALTAGRHLSLDEAMADGAQFAAEAASLPVPEVESVVAAAHGLTEREREVLGLLVEGRSNPEIARCLSISPKTASNHVTNILAKLGVESRTAAATQAVRQGLV
jgi:DNA-binding CsgD family transcriptional regulator